MGAIIVFEQYPLSKYKSLSWDNNIGVLAKSCETCMCLRSVSRVNSCVFEDLDAIANNIRNVSFATPRLGLGQTAFSPAGNRDQRDRNVT
jgi:hypothetical protein